MDSIARLLELVELYAKHRELAGTTVSRKITGSGDTVPRLRNGGDISTKRYDRSIRRLSEDWPAGVPWPSRTPRP